MQKTTGKAMLGVTAALLAALLLTGCSNDKGSTSSSSRPAPASSAASLPNGNSSAFMEESETPLESMDPFDPIESLMPEDMFSASAGNVSR